jgi:hypothetical protein
MLEEPNSFAMSLCKSVKKESGMLEAAWVALNARCALPETSARPTYVDDRAEAASALMGCRELKSVTSEGVASC